MQETKEMDEVINASVISTHDSNQKINLQTGSSSASARVCSSYASSYTSPEANAGHFLNEHLAIVNPESNSEYANPYARGHISYPDNHSSYASYSSPEVNDGPPVYDIANPESNGECMNPCTLGKTRFPDIHPSHANYASLEANDDPLVCDTHAIVNPGSYSDYIDPRTRGHIRYPNHHSKHANYTPPEANEISPKFEVHAIANPKSNDEYANPHARGLTRYPDQTLFEADHGSRMYQEHAVHNSWVQHDHRHAYQSQYYGASYTTDSNDYRAHPYGERYSYQDGRQNYHNSYNEMYTCNSGEEHTQHNDKNRCSEASHNGK